MARPDWRSFMTRQRTAALEFFLVLLTLVLAPPATSQAPQASQTPKSGGVLNMMLREDLAQGFAIHETATISTVWPAMPCLNNLVLFDPLKKTESEDTIIGELAEKWSWQDNRRNLVFFLRKGVKWHDDQPFTSKDVKFTFDMLREAADARARRRSRPASSTCRSRARPRRRRPSSSRTRCPSSSSRRTTRTSATTSS